MNDEQTKRLALKDKISEAVRLAMQSYIWDLNIDQDPIQAVVLNRDRLMAFVLDRIAEIGIQ